MSASTWRDPQKPFTPPSKMYSWGSANTPDRVWPFMSTLSFCQAPKTWTPPFMVKTCRFMFPSAVLEVAIMVPLVTFTFPSAQKSPDSDS